MPEPAGPQYRAFGLDVARVLAAVGVVVTHVAFATGVVNPLRWSSPLRDLLPRLDVGVSIFFVLSGLLVARPFVRSVLGDAPAPALGDYVRRRASRIYPVYLFVLVFVVVASGAGGRGPAQLAADALLVHVYVPRWAIGPITQSWTLSTEIAFYAFLPLWFGASRSVFERRGTDRAARVRWTAAGLAVWVLVALVWRLGVLAVTPQFELGRPGMVDTRGALLTWLPNHLDEFAVGVGLALWIQSGRARAMPLAARLGTYAVGAAALWTASTALGLPPVFTGFDGPQTVGRHLLFVVCAAAVVAPSALAGQPRRSGPAWTPPAWAGTAVTGAALGSYGLYLWHQWVTDEWFRARGLRDFVAPFPTVLAVVLVVGSVLAAATYWLVERPSELLATGRGGVEARPPRQLGPVPALDGLRGLSILAVLATHVVFLDGGRDRFSLPGGFLGVDVFLALSGFLIGLVLLREVDASGTLDGKDFARRRARRLYPPLVVFLVVEGLVAVLFVGTALQEQGLQSLLSLTFTANWQLTFGHQPPFALVHLWSLALEGQFYVLLAVGVWALRKRLGRPDRLVAWCVVGAAAVVLWRLWLLRQGASLPALYERTDARLDSLLLGLAAAFVWRSRLTSSARLRAAGLGGLLVLGVCWVVARPTSEWLYMGGFTVVAAAAALAVAAAATGDGPVARLGNLRVLRWVGMISFSLYLWHLPVYLWVVDLMPRAPLALKVAVAVPASFLAGWLGFVLVERRVLATWRRSTDEPVPTT